MAAFSGWSTVLFFLTALPTILFLNPAHSKHWFDAQYTIVNTSKDNANKTNCKPTIMMATESLVDPVAEQRGTEEAGVEEEEVRDFVLIWQCDSLVVTPSWSPHCHSIFGSVLIVRWAHRTSWREKTYSSESDRIYCTVYFLASLESI
jgi:hypothetical protein